MDVREMRMIFIEKDIKLFILVDLLNRTELKKVTLPFLP
jgi:hypothetical protein